jgi:altronate hydrolase
LRKINENIMANKFLKIHPDDNVLVALTDLESGEQIDYNGYSISIISHIPAKHKFAINSLNEGDPIIMYGILVGKATQTILPGNVLATHNVKHQASAFTEKTTTHQWKAPNVKKWVNRTFNGFHRGVENDVEDLPLLITDRRGIPAGGATHGCWCSPSSL